MKIDVALLHESGYIKIDIVRLRTEFKKLLMEQNEDYLA